MAKKVPSERLSATISKVLAEYSADVTQSIEDIAKRLTKEGVKTMRAESRSRGWGETTGYAAGWTSQFETGRTSLQGTIYNEVSGLPHLLEKSHALRQGGRTNAHVHIAPVEQEIIKAFLEAVERDIS